MLRERPACDCGEAYAGGNCRSYCARKQKPAGAEAPATRTWDPRAWVPHREGAFYCSQACGGGCTWGQYQAAVARAQVLVDQLGAGWAPRVHENLGWYASAYYQDIALLYVTDFRPSVEPRYHAYLDGGRWSGAAQVPQEAVNNVVGQLLAAQAELGHICDKLEGLDS